MTQELPAKTNILQAMEGSNSAVSQHPPLTYQGSKRQETNNTLTERTTSVRQKPMNKILPCGWRFERNGRYLTFRVEEMVGEGTFGKVYRARILETKEIVAIKYIELQPGLNFREVDILKSLQHRNICQLKYSFSVRDKSKVAVLLVLEYVPFSLFAVLKRCSRARRRIDEKYIMLVMFQLLRGVAYMHSKGICHRDLKPANILLSIRTSELKICDFGCAKFLQESKEKPSYVCSRFYRAPEIILSCPYTKAVDLWSVGCIFVEFYKLQVLFSGASSVDQLAQIIQVLGTPTVTDLRDLGQLDLVFTFKSCPSKHWREVLGWDISDEAVDLISKMLVYSPVKRITANEALQHSYFNPIYQPGFSIHESVRIPDLFDHAQEKKVAK